ncbi:hypothetical protein T484DRAFT_1760229 [Baffinella frigidus]|nr:hypothetical protein T484DRAFT_1760229 [Cryptophyta sp. CCMP2293]
MHVGGLHHGWLGNLPLDLSDHQWRADLAFHVVSNLGFIYFLHGFSVIWPLGTALLSFFIGRTLRGSIWNPVSTRPNSANAHAAPAPHLSRPRQLALPRAAERGSALSSQR